MAAFARSLILATLIASASPALAQSSATPTHPSFDGVWTNGSATRLERPANFKTLVVPEAEADEIVKASIERTNAANAPTDTSQGAFKDANNAAGYNAFWTDPGIGLMSVRGEARSSFITSPADGKMPFRDRAKSLALTIRDGVEYRSGKGAYAGPEDLPIRERCLIAQSDAGGPVMLNAIYNNNYSFFLTPGYFVIDLEMNHDVRIAPIFPTAENPFKYIYTYRLRQE